MPDLQTEIFRKVLPNLHSLAFDDPDENEEISMPIVTSESIPLTRQAFDYIKANPNCIGKDVLNFFTADGHKRSVVASTITALIVAKRIKRENRKLILLRDDYDQPKKVTKVTAPKEKVETIKSPVYDTWSADKVLDGLTLYQGRALYDRLKELFGA